MLSFFLVIQSFHIVTILFHWSYLHLFTAPQKYEIFLSIFLELITIKIDSLMDA